ncbi:MAG: stage II sporulation protein P [Oscillospiraceae bacterium]|nr:stage II sporulation protein P [Oscillospiraceae bacterium]
MRFFKRRIFNKMLACSLAVIISPLAAFSVSEDFFGISGVLQIPGRSSTHEPATVTISPINNGTRMMYTLDEYGSNLNFIDLNNNDSPDFVKTFEFPGFPYEIEEFFEKQPDKSSEKSNSDEALPVMSQNISFYSEDLSVFSAGNGKVTKMTFRPELSRDYLQLDGGGRVRNTTDIADSVLLRESRKPLSFKPVKNVSEPQVLIIHTHTTEGFRPSDDSRFNTDYIFRTVDSDKNIVAVGAKIAEEIAKQGFTVIHDGTLHDYPVYSGAYTRSADTVKAILEEYPSIQIVLDIHRDAIESDGNPVAAVAEVNGREAAQIMIISPADDGNWGVPHFMENFRLAGRIQSKVESDNPGLTRSLLFQYCNYNLHLSPGSLLIEIGSHGNTLDQALYAGELFGRSFGKMLSELDY